MFSISNLSYGVGSFSILKGIDCTFARSKFNIILGQNGSGKSTLLKCLSGLISPTEGAVYFDADNLRSLSLASQANRRSVLLQQNLCSERLKVNEILSLGRISSRGNNSSYLKYLTVLFDVQKLLNKELNQLSGGEQQRVHFVRVLNQLGEENLDTKVLLLDEPISAADINYQMKFLEFVEKQVSDKGLTAIAILHDLSLGLRYADWVVGLKEGRLVVSCAKQQVLDSKILTDIFEVDFEILKLSNNRTFILPKTKTIDGDKQFKQERELSRAV